MVGKTRVGDTDFDSCHYFYYKTKSPISCKQKLAGKSLFFIIIEESVVNAPTFVYLVNKLARGIGDVFEVPCT